MARIRTIKPEFFQHDGLAELSAWHRLLFIGLWTQADREGRMLDRPKRLRAALFPYDPTITEEQLDVMLWDLAEHGERFIVRYELDGEQYIAVSAFVQHQRPHPRDPESVIPIPTEEAVRKRVNTRSAVDCRGSSGRSPDAPLSNSPLSKSPKTPLSKIRNVAKTQSPSSDAEFLESLAQNPAYAGIDLKVEYGKMDAWLLLHPHRKKTRRFVVTWLNRADRPLNGGPYGGSHRPSGSEQATAGETGTGTDRYAATRAHQARRVAARARDASGAGE